MAERKDDNNLKNEEAEGNIGPRENRDTEPDSTVQNVTTTAGASASAVQIAAADSSPTTQKLDNPLLKSLLVRKPDASEGPRSMMARQSTMPPPAMPPANTPPENSAAAVSENSAASASASVSESPKRATKRADSSDELPPSPTKKVKSPKKSPEKKPDA